MSAQLELQQRPRASADSRSSARSEAMEVGHSLPTDLRSGARVTLDQLTDFPRPVRDVARDAGLIVSAVRRNLADLAEAGLAEGIDDQWRRS